MRLLCEPCPLFLRRRGQKGGKLCNASCLFTSNCENDRRAYLVAPGAICQDGSLLHGVSRQVSLQRPSHMGREASFTIGASGAYERTSPAQHVHAVVRNDAHNGRYQDVDPSRKARIHAYGKWNLNHRTSYGARTGNIPEAEPLVQTGMNEYRRTLNWEIASGYIMMFSAVTWSRSAH